MDTHLLEKDRACVVARWPYDSMRLSGHPSNRLAAHNPHTCSSDGHILHPQSSRCGSAGYCHSGYRNKTRGWVPPRVPRFPLCTLIIDANPIGRPGAACARFIKEFITVAAVGNLFRNRNWDTNSPLL